jgi:hypothetical protein
MFNLEQSIAAWRQQMLAAGIKTPVPLEELEIHLREEIVRQMESGLDKQKAFEISVQRVGQPKVLDREFKRSEGMFMKRNTKIGTGVAGILIGMALTIPGSVQLRDELVMANGRLGLWLLGGFLLCWSFALFQEMFLPKARKEVFEKAEMTPKKQPVKTVAGIISLLIGITLLLPAAAQAWQEGLVEFAALGGAVFGIALLITGALVTFSPYEKYRA